MQIKTENLTHIFDKGMITEFLAVDNVSANIDQGEFVAIIGHTGSGKTTFIEHLNALLRPTTGKVIFDNERVITHGRRKIKNIKDLRKRVGIVFQFAEYQLFEETIEKDIIFGPVTMGTPREEAKELAKKYIKLVGMDESFLSRSPFALSGGQKRRVAIAGIMAMEPDFLIFDEPTAGLDPQGEIEMYEIFEKLNKLGKTVIVVTHNLDHVLEHTKRSIMFKKGKIIADKDSIELMYDEQFLIKNSLKPPKLVSLVSAYKTKSKQDFKKVRTIEEFAKEIVKGKVSKRKE